MRNAEFNREEVLRSAMAAFMLKGYSKTSMQDLTKTTGLHPGSIYCAFENKRGLLLAALEQYNQDRNIEFNIYFSGSHSFLIELKNYLNNIVNECISGDAAKACLLTKALNELAEQDDELQAIITENLTNWQNALTEKFSQAIITKELKSTRECDHLARCFVMGIYGLRTFAHTHPHADILHQLADQLYNDICA